VDGRYPGMKVFDIASLIAVTALLTLALDIAYSHAIAGAIAAFGRGFVLP